MVGAWSLSLLKAAQSSTCSLHLWKATSFTYASEGFFTDLTPTFQNKFNFKPSRSGKTISLPTSGTEFDYCVFNLRLPLN